MTRHPTIPEPMDRRIKSDNGGALGLYTPGAGNPVIAQAARSVLTNRHATVI